MAIRPTDHFAAASGTAHPAVVGLRALADELCVPDYIKLARVAEADMRAKEDYVLADKSGGCVDGVMDRGARAAGNKDERAKRAKKKREQAFDTTMYLLMLDQQIADLEEKIEGYNEQIAAANALIKIFKEDNDIDPNNPDHRALLRILKIPEDEWGIVTLDDVQARLDDLKSKRDKATASLDQKQRERQKYNSYPSGSPEQEAVIAQELDSKRLDIINSKPEQVELEKEWFMSQVLYERLNSGDHVISNSLLNTMIDDLDDVTRKEMEMDTNLPNEIRNRILALNVYKDIANIPINFQGSPKYDFFVDRILSDLPESGKQALMVQSDLPTAINNYYTEEAIPPTDINPNHQA